ncbi:aldo/keto reductase [Halovivax sp.]|uniref:aldo/keto reductase n=1 Tax=Halovivax sp. TaxID=1935978 RepID=UPI0025BCFFD0|nr:aldo/keto reductase [Halovivax sp.]
MTVQELPPIGLGTYGVEPARCTAAVATALQLGYRHVDTAEMYENEAAVGDALAASSVDREDVFVATKVHSTHLSYDDVLAAVERSRRRLGVDAVDCCYVHWPIRTYDAAETLAAFDELSDRGTIRRVGLSNFTPELLADALDHLEAPLFAHQVECHPLLPQNELRRLAREHDHSLVAYSPLAKGTATEVPELVEVADRRGATPAQVSLAWLLSKENVVAIPKSTSRTHLRENLAAADLDLDERDLALIDGIERRERQVDVPEAPWNRS